MITKDVLRATEEKMKNSMFSLVPSDLEPHGDNKRPDLVREAVQVFECTWDDSYPLTDMKDAIEYHFLLRLDRILLKPKWKKCLEKGRGFPRLPVDYGFRDNNQFWLASHSAPYRVPIHPIPIHLVFGSFFATGRIVEPGRPGPLQGHRRGWISRRPEVRKQPIPLDD